MLSDVDILNIRKKLAIKRDRARREALKRQQRTAMLEILFKYVPKQEDVHKRTQAIDKLADELVTLIYEQEENA